MLIHLSAEDNFNAESERDFIADARPDLISPYPRPEGFAGLSKPSKYSENIDLKR